VVELHLVRTAPVGEDRTSTGRVIGGVPLLERVVRVSLLATLDAQTSSRGCGLRAQTLDEGDGLLDRLAGHLDPLLVGTDASHDYSPSPVR
jgi:hypothetical protein